MRFKENKPIIDVKSTPLQDLTALMCQGPGAALWWSGLWGSSNSNVGFRCGWREWTDPRELRRNTVRNTVRYGTVLQYEYLLSTYIWNLYQIQWFLGHIIYLYSCMWLMKLKSKWFSVWAHVRLRPTVFILRYIFFREYIFIFFKLK